MTWSKKSVTNRGLTNDGNDVAEDARKNAVQKNIQLEYMLGYIAQHSPALLRNDIVKNSTSLKWIWQRIRKHYSFNQSEVHFLKLYAIKREAEERYETLYQRILAHLEDNLLTVESGIHHDGAVLTADEVVTPTVERIAVFLWLNLIDSRLPAYISRVYAHDLQSKSLKDVQPQVCEAMDSLLTEIATQDDVQINVARSSYPPRQRWNPQQQNPSVNNRFNQNNNNNNNNNNNGRNVVNNNNGARPRTNQRGQQQKQCILCKTAGRAYIGHDISTCWRISKFDKLEIIDAFQVNTVCENEETCYVDEEPEVLAITSVQPTEDVSQISSDTTVTTVSVAAGPLSIRRVQCDISPFFYAFYRHYVVKVVIDSGAQSSMISASFVKRVNLKQEPTLHGARQLDKSSVKVSGEIRFELSFGSITLPIDGLVNEHLDCDVLAGVPFCKGNKIVLDMPNDEISIQGNTIPYGCKPDSLQHDIFHNTMILRNDQSRVIYPGDYVEVNCNNLNNYEDEEVAIEPRIDSPLQGEWPSPSISRVIQGSVRIPNNTCEPIKIKKCQHFAQIRRVTTPDVLASISSPNLDLVQPELPSQRTVKQSPAVPHSATITVDPDKLMDKDSIQRFHNLHKRFDNVFNPKFSRYNGASGPFIGDIKFGNVEPPASKTKVPFYNQCDLRQLQIEADKLEDLGVLVKPEDLGLDVKFASPSFLRTKPCGGLRFVTDFNELGQYTRTLPVTTVTTDSVLRNLAQWKYVIKTDLTQSFFQIPVSKSSMPYLGTVTPFKGLRLYIYK